MDDNSNLSPAQQCGLLLMLLEEEAAIQIVARLDPQEIQKLGAAIYSLSEVDRAKIETVMDGFLQKAESLMTVGDKKEEKVGHLFTKALGNERASSILRKIASGDSKRHVEILKWMDVEAISEAIRDEHPQVAALVLSQLSAEHAADVLALIPETRRADLILRIASLDNIPSEALEELEHILQAKFYQSKMANGLQMDGIEAAARILNNLPSENNKSIVDTISLVNEEMTNKIRENMFSFDDLANVDEKSLQNLLRSIENENLIKALKGCQPSLRDKILSCMSSRAATQIIDEMESMGPVKITEVREAQKMVVKQARLMADKGEIMLSQSGRDYV